MICATCFAENAESAAVCANCGRALPQIVPEADDGPDQAAGAAAAPYAAQMPRVREDPRPVDVPVFRDPTTLQKWLLGLLLALGAILVLAIIQDIAQIFLIDNILALGYAEFADDAEANDLRQQVAGAAYLLVFFATLIAFGMWIFRMAKNARAFSTETFAITPGWAVGSYFIPIVNLWIPFRAMSEIWRASRNPAGWRNDRAGEFLGWWWAVWVASNLAANVNYRFVSDAKTLEDIRQASQISIATELLTIASVVMALLLVQRLTAYQMQASRGESLHKVFE